MRILLAEDDSALRSVLERGRRESGYVVDAVADGESALGYLRIYEYEVAVLDWRMPALSGLDVVRGSGLGLAIADAVVRSTGAGGGWTTARSAAPGCRSPGTAPRTGRAALAAQRPARVTAASHGPTRPRKRSPSSSPAARLAVIVHCRRLAPATSRRVRCIQSRGATRAVSSR